MQTPMRIASLLAALALLPGAALSAEPPPRAAIAFSRDICRSNDPAGDMMTLLRTHGIDVPPSLDPQDRGGGNILLVMPDGAITVWGHGSQRRVRVTLEGVASMKGRSVLTDLTPDCSVRLVRMLVSDAAGRASRLYEFDAASGALVSEEALNPPVPPGEDPGGVAVALLDSGLTYTLEIFAERLARDASGIPYARDFADDDDRPFDVDPGSPPFFPRRHGTAVASILVQEAPAVRLVTVRYPGTRFDRFADAVNYIASTPARIVVMPLGSSRPDHWTRFREAIREHQDILFVVSAGNDGRDIDDEPVYPASFDEDNLLSVTSTDAFGRIAPDSNWGRRHVDLAVPAERVEVVDHRGARGRASGSSYAVPRVAALAARLQAAHPEWPASRLKQEILSLAAPLATQDKPVAAGWIPNPALE